MSTRHDDLLHALDDAALDALADRLAGRVAAPLLDAKAAGALLNVPGTWLLAEARADRVPYVRLGRYVRFDAAELEAWWRARARGPWRDRGAAAKAARRRVLAGTNSKRAGERMSKPNTGRRRSVVPMAVPNQPCESRPVAVRGKEKAPTRGARSSPQSLLAEGSDNTTACLCVAATKHTASNESPASMVTTFPLLSWISKSRMAHTPQAGSIVRAILSTVSACCGLPPGPHPRPSLRCTGSTRPTYRAPARRIRSWPRSRQ